VDHAVHCGRTQAEGGEQVRVFHLGDDPAEFRPWPVTNSAVMGSALNNLAVG
jgi:hypothetical protein